MEELNYKKLFVPYTKDGHTFEAALAFFVKKAMELRIPEELLLRSVYEVFFEISKGKEYPKNKCPCGCGIDKAGTAVIHEILTRMIKYNVDDKSKAILAQIQQRVSPPVEEKKEEPFIGARVEESTRFQRFKERIKNGLVRSS